MLKYLNSEIILEPQNDHFKSQRQAYQNCLDSFEGIKSLIAEKKAPIAEKHFSEPSPNLKRNHNRAVISILTSNRIQQKQ